MKDDNELELNFSRMRKAAGIDNIPDTVMSKLDFSDTIKTRLVVPKAGYTTSQGQLTVLFQLVASALVAYGVWQGATAENLEAIYKAAIIIIPLILAQVHNLNTYINSRGKIQSNAINADTALKAAILTEEGMPRLVSGDIHESKSKPC